MSLFREEAHINLPSAHAGNRSSMTGGEKERHQFHSEALSQNRSPIPIYDEEMGCISILNRKRQVEATYLTMYSVEKNSYGILST